MGPTNYREINQDRDTHRKVIPSYLRACIHSIVMFVIPVPEIGLIDIIHIGDRIIITDIQRSVYSISCLVN